jgi:SAM-dependent methyltransferase
MFPKPKHLGPEYAAQFQDAAVVAAYPARPPYPAAIFETLAGLAAASPRAVLDVGCGTGDVARRLAPLVDRLDAVDASARMITLARTLPGGDAPNLRWIVASAEDAPLDPPYALITAGESLHWMDWAAVIPRFRAALAPGGYLAIVERGEQSSPWSEDLLTLIQCYSTNKDFQPYNLIAELESRDLFTRTGHRTTEPEPFGQPVAAYIESIHSRNGFSRDRMPPAEAHAFDTAVRELVAPYARDGILQLKIAAEATWGVPGEGLWWQRWTAM